MTTAPSSPHQELQGILYMLWGALWFAIMTATVRHLSSHLDAFEIVFFRNAFALLAMMPWVVRTGLSVLNTRCMKLYLWRGINGLVSMAAWFYVLGHIPLSTAIALSFTAPLFTTLAAMLFLGERVGSRRWLALIIGFLGTLVILRPGLEGFNSMFLWVLFSSLLWAISNIIIKRLTATESPQLIVFYMTLIMTPLSLPLALLNWKMPTLIELGWLVVLGLSSNMAQLAISHAYGKADMSILQPFDFARLIFATIIGYFAFHEMIDMWTLAGAIIIVSSTVYITYRERRARKGTS